MNNSTITIKLYDGVDDEIEHELPAKNEVCYRCQGFGMHLNPSIGNHAYSREEFDEAFDDDESREAYFARGGMYDVSCEECHGNKVILEVDEDMCMSSSKLKPIFEAWQKQEQERAQSEAEDRAEQRMESGMLGEDW